MHPELRVVDAVLDDQRFLEPFRGRFSARRGRYTIPMETYLRMMYLKTKYQLGYESLVEEVTDSVSWRRFCRISLSGRVPDASTLIKLTNGPCQGLADEVHDALVRELAKKKVLRGRKVRVDTTVVEADIHYPTDADLLADGVRVVTRRAWSEVIYGTSARPGISGIRGRVPAAITIVSPLIRSPATSRVFSPTNLPFPLNTVIFDACWFPSSTAWASPATSSAARRMMNCQSSASTLALMPNSSARWMVSITSAEWINILDGMQPRLRQVPPKDPSSTTATESPRCAASEETSRPEPERMTITSNLFTHLSPATLEPPL